MYNYIEMEIINLDHNKAYRMECDKHIKSKKSIPIYLVNPDLDIILISNKISRINSDINNTYSIIDFVGIDENEKYDLKDHVGVHMKYSNIENDIILLIPRSMCGLILLNNYIKVEDHKIVEINNINKAIDILKPAVKNNDSEINHYNIPCFIYDNAEFKEFLKNRKSFCNLIYTVDNNVLEPVSDKFSLKIKNDESDDIYDLEFDSKRKLEIDSAGILLKTNQSTRYDNYIIILFSKYVINNKKRYNKVNMIYKDNQKIISPIEHYIINILPKSYNSIITKLPYCNYLRDGEITEYIRKGNIIDLYMPQSIASINQYNIHEGLITNYQYTEDYKLLFSYQLCRKTPRISLKEYTNDLLKNKNNPTIVFLKFGTDDDIKIIGYIVDDSQVLLFCKSILSNAIINM